MINCFVLDDEQHAVDVLVHYIRQTPFLHLAGTSLDPLQALPLINEEAPDLLFTDIHMPALSGIDLLKSIRSKTRVILCSASGEYAAMGFELEVIDYLVKPVRFARFLQSVQRAAHLIGGTMAASPLPLEDDYMYVKTEQKGKLLKVNLHDIEYIEGRKNYVAIHHNGQTTLALLNMKDLELRLPARHFIRVHKSFIVPIRKITGVESNIILMKDCDARIVLGENYRGPFLALLKGKIL